MDNGIAKNTIANLVAKIWNFVSLYIFVPIWISFLGIEGYGIVSFFAILSSLLGFADAGITATITREFSRADIDNKYKLNLLKTIERLYVCIAVVVFLVVFLSASYIVTLFLKSNSLQYEDLVYYVRLMGGIAAVNFLFYMYNGGIIGLQKQVEANLLLITYSFLRSVVVILILYFFPTVLSFLLWQLVSVVFMTLIVRCYLLRQISVDKYKAFFQLSLIKTFWKFSLGMMLMSILSSLNTQVDKLVTGNVLSIEYLGYYSLASSFSMAVLFLSQPLGTAFYPELTRLISLRDNVASEKLFLLFTYLISLLSTGIGLLLLLYSDDLMMLWLHDCNIVSMIQLPACILIIGYVFMSFQFPPYYLAMANGYMKINVQTGIVFVIVSIPSIYVLGVKIGLIGVALPFTVINFFATLYLGYSIIHKFMPNRLIEFVKYSITPIFPTLVTMLLVYYIISAFCDAHLLKVLLGITSFVVSLYVALLALLILDKEIVPTAYFEKIRFLIPSSIMNKK